MNKWVKFLLLVKKNNEFSKLNDNINFNGKIINDNQLARTRNASRSPPLSAIFSANV